jgi:hypothetical protein
LKTAGRRTVAHRVAAPPVFLQDVPLAWAALCGTLSAVGLRWQVQTLGRVFVVVVLVEFVLRWTAESIAQIGSGSPANPGRALPSAAFPYAKSGSPAHHFLEWTVLLRDRWRAFWSPLDGMAGRILAFSVASGLVLVYVLGMPAAWAGLAGLALAVLSGLWLRSRPRAARVGVPLALTATAWVVAAIAAGGAFGWPLLAAPLFGLAAAGLAAIRSECASGRALLWAGFTAPAALLVAERLATPAVAILFVAVPAYVLTPLVKGTPDAYLRRVQPLLWTSMILTALALGW